jgi:hypothetical protein
MGSIGIHLTSEYDTVDMKEIKTISLILGSFT